MNDAMNTDLVVMLAGLRVGSQEMPWPQRRLLVARLAAALADGGANRQTVLDLVHLLAEDPKWEVRSDLAELLLLVPEHDFARLAARLSEDSNSYVRKAAHRALDRRRKGQQHSQGLTDDLDRLRCRWEAFERRHGRQAAAQARRVTDQQFDHMVGATVHEMRNVLTPLKAGIASMQQRLDEPLAQVADLRRAADKAAGQIAFLERLLGDMRSFSQPLPVRRRRERLHPVIQEAVTMAQESLVGVGRDPSGVELQVDVSQGIALDMARCHIVGAVANIVKNAIEAYAVGPASFCPGVVRVVAHWIDANHVEIAIEDWGMGIAPDDLEELRQFLPGKTTKRNQGTGFGLPIARRNVRAHGGELSIASQDGKGTTVTIVLPTEQCQGDET